jgi:hypothetical protein
MPNTVSTMAEGLQKVLADLSACLVAPDADMQFIQNVQNLIVTRMRAGIGGTPGMGGPGQGQPGQPPQGGPGGPQPGQMPGGPGGGGMPPGALPGALGGLGGMGGGGVPGVRSMPQMPPVDELRRLLQGQAGG